MRCPESVDHGFSAVELVVVLGLISIAAGISVPATTYTIDAARAVQAADFVAARLHAARLRAAATARASALVFDELGGTWIFRLCEDADDDGVRRADMLSGIDRCPDGPYDLAAMFPGVSVGVDPGLPGPGGEPGSANPVRFGSSSVASFSPAGTATAGTLFLRTRQGRQFAVRVSNITGRTRVLRYDTGTRQWTAG